MHNHISKLVLYGINIYGIIIVFKIMNAKFVYYF